jgi:hypothetical protein
MRSIMPTSFRRLRDPTVLLSRSVLTKKAPGGTFIPSSVLASSISVIVMFHIGLVSAPLTRERAARGLSGRLVQLDHDERKRSPDVWKAGDSVLNVSLIGVIMG